MLQLAKLNLNMRFQHLLTGSEETGLRQVLQFCMGNQPSCFVSKTNFNALCLTHDISTNCPGRTMMSLDHLLEVVR